MANRHVRVAGDAGVGGCLAIVATAAGVYAILAALVTWLWDAALRGLFHAPAVSFWQVAALLIVLNVLTRVFWPSRGGE